MDARESNPPICLVILIPVFNDWEPVRQLIPQIDQHLPNCSAEIILLDDGSTTPPPEIWEGSFQSVEKIELLRLRRNLGHQRALAVGLSYVEANRTTSAVLVMDGDGEDDPADVPRLLQRSSEEGDGTLVFAERTKRAENRVFRIGYALYRFVHLLLTGIPVRVGNFSLIPSPLLSRLVVVSDLWNHYAASVFKSRIPYVMVPTKRAQRLGGQSKMNAVALVEHGLSAISVFADRVASRLLVAFSSLFVFIVAALLTLFVLGFLTDVSVPRWITSATGFLVIVFMQMVTLIIVFVFVVLGGRENAKFLPLRDHVYFVKSVDRAWPRDE